MACGAILGAQSSALIANLAIPSELMGKGFIIFLFLMAIAMWFKNKRPPRDNTTVKLAVVTKKNRLITFGIGLILGIISDLFGAGGG